MRSATSFASLAYHLGLFQSTRSVRSATAKALQLQRQQKKFQSTRSVRSATVLRLDAATVPANFNPRAPCGARLATTCSEAAALIISIHALRAERDCKESNKKRRKSVISIHALRAERDVLFDAVWARRCQFQSTRSVRSATIVQCQ